MEPLTYEHYKVPGATEANMKHKHKGCWMFVEINGKENMFACRIFR